MIWPPIPPRGPLGPRDGNENGLADLAQLEFDWLVYRLMKYCSELCGTSFIRNAVFDCLDTTFRLYFYQSGVGARIKLELILSRFSD